LCIQQERVESSRGQKQQLLNLVRKIQFLSVCFFAKNDGKRTELTTIQKAWSTIGKNVKVVVNLFKTLTSKLWLQKTRCNRRSGQRRLIANVQWTHQGGDDPSKNR
jgi:hypothetical protein